MLRINIFQLKKTIITCKTHTKAYQVKNFTVVKLIFIIIITNIVNIKLIFKKLNFFNMKIS